MIAKTFRVPKASRSYSTRSLRPARTLRDHAGRDEMMFHRRRHDDIGHAGQGNVDA
jgi:hypothetical protein